jgi:hypothetical protein
MPALMLALTAGLYAAFVLALCRAAASADRSMERMHREHLD